VHSTSTGKRVTGVNKATVYWKPFPDAVIDNLVKKGDIFTCAGGFVVEDPELSSYLDRTEGTIDAIEGLPIKPLRELLLLAAAPPVTHVLFDMDGLLLDTESAYTVAQQEIVDRWGKTFNWDLKSKMMGKKALEAAQILVDDLGLQGKITAEEFVTEREKKLDVLFANSSLLPGVEKLIRHLDKHKVPMAVATSSHRRHFDLKTGKHKELFGLMHHIVTGDQVEKSKPAPDIFLTAAGQFDGDVPDPGSVLVFEDAPNGVEAGRAAGMQVCHVPDANLGVDQRGGAHCELASLQQFRPDDWGLPPY
jgi:pseudouridine-5'-monophosphatase